MPTFQDNVVFFALAIALVIVPGTALQTRRVRNSTSAPGTAQKISCTSEPDLEFYLDSLSFKVYEGVQWGSDVGNVSLKEVRAPSENQGDLNSQAAWRIRHFIQAVESVNANKSISKSVAVVGSQQHSKSLSNRSSEHGTNSAYCCHHVPDNHPYWQETEKYHQTHPGYIKCEFSDNCKRQVTNGMRVKSIRRALKGSQSLFQKLDVPSLLYGGSAIGQLRCGDVIPWDVDCDFMISAASIAVIHEKVFGTKLDWDNWKAGETSMDLKHLGAPGIRLVKKTPCTPFEIVDTQEGFFCDVFPSKWYQSELYTPWWSGTYPCPTLFGACDKAGGGKRCYKFDSSQVQPPTNCVMSGVMQYCSPAQSKYLHTLYGPGWHQPNQSIPVSLSG